MLEIVILAAGKGTRMKSKLPKVLHKLAGKPLLEHVLSTARQLNPDVITLVIGPEHQQISEDFAAPDVRFVVQEKVSGTGDAVAQALPLMQSGSRVLVLYGDVPLLSPKTLTAMLAQNARFCLLTAELADAKGYGRILRDEGKIIGIVEEKDANPEQKQICEINTGIMLMRSDDLQRWLPALSADNAQQEYYLTDIVAMAHEEDIAIVSETCLSEYEIQGINSRAQLADLERRFQFKMARSFLDQGVVISDPQRFDCRGQLHCGIDVSIDINCLFEGEVVLADGVTIEPNCIIRNASIGRNSHIKANSIIDDSVIEESCDVGPFARVRPGTKLADNAKLGNFVETKKSVIGPGSKVNHLTYIGDAEIGRDVNVGAGTITCNYDGVNKSKTRIGDRAFIGSNTSLVAPVTVGSDATIGAGSTITKDVSDGNLGVARGRQVEISTWQRPTKKEKQ